MPKPTPRGQNAEGPIRTSGSRGKKQIAKLTKKQLGANFAQNVLLRISDLAGGVRDLVFKGKAVDNRGQMIAVSCAPDDIQRGLSTEQLVAVEDFVSVWAPPEPEKPGPEPKPA
jgi:hypothetical protein